MNLIGLTKYLQRKSSTQFLPLLMVFSAASGNALASSYADRCLSRTVGPDTRWFGLVSGASDIYRFHTPHSSITVRLISSRRSNAALVLWTENQKIRKEYLTLPGGWWPTTRGETDTPQPLPSVLLWRVGQHPLLVLVGQRDSGVYGYCCPILYQFRANHWQIIPNKTKLLQFSNRGSFYMEGNKLYVWDYAAESAISHGAPQHYWLREFAWKHGQLALLKNLVTKGKYQNIQGLDDVSGTIPRAFDPLREFGLRWRWWGARAE